MAHTRPSVISTLTVTRKSIPTVHFSPLDSFIPRKPPWATPARAPRTISIMNDEAEDMSNEAVCKSQHRKEIVDGLGRTNAE
jgi:hypothetical protein